jgi:hypothetical protein
MRRLAVLLVSAVIALTLVAFAVATGASAQQQPGATDFYGVLYWSDTELHWETGTSKATTDEAASAACQDANDGPCELAAWVYNGWVAYTEGANPDGTVYANASWDRKQSDAEANGLAGCEADGATDCTTVDSWGTRFNPSKQTRGGFK